MVVAGVGRDRYIEAAPLRFAVKLVRVALVKHRQGRRRNGQLEILRGGRRVAVAGSNHEVER